MELLDSTQRETRELMSALCQVQSDRVRDLVAKDLREQLSKVVDERFLQLELTLRPRMARARLEVARGITQVLSDCFAKMRRFESDRQWCDALLEATAAMSRRSAFFSIRSGNICFQGARGMELSGRQVPQEMPLASAPTFANVVKTAECTTVSRTAADVSNALFEFFGNVDGRALLVPLVVDGKVPGIIYVEDPVDPSAITAIAAMAAAALEKYLGFADPVRPPSPSGAIRAVPVISSRLEAPAAPATRLGPPAQAIRPLKAPDAPARRFAQVEVARMILNFENAVSQGRLAGDLYVALKGPIDRARADFQARFGGTRDLLHDEMIQTLARGDAALLGRDYPGPLA